MASTEPAEVEMFAIQLQGGPDEGRFAAYSNQNSWPLPGILGAKGGRYVKVSESQAPPAMPDSGYVRGALYEWQPDQEGSSSAETQSRG